MSVIEKKKTRNLIGRNIGQSKSALMKYFKDVNEFPLSTKIRLKCFNKSIFQSGEMKKRATNGKYRESIVIVLKGTQLIIQEGFDQHHSHGKLNG